MKTILVCCGSSMVTSTITMNKLKTEMEKAGIPVNFVQCKFSEVPASVKTHHPDVIVPTGALDESSAGGVPVVRGTSFITGAGEKQTVEKIKEILLK